MIALSVNLNKLALIRNSRDTSIPDLVLAANTCIKAGCHGITVHPRPDQRHIRPDDVHQIASAIDVEFNVEGNPLAGARESYPGFLKLVEAVKPAQCTLVPDGDNQLTSDHGWDLSGDNGQLREMIKELQNQGIRVSLFMDPDPIQLDAAKAIGTDRIEFYTGPYADAFFTPQRDAVYQQFHQAASHGQNIGLGINAGHDLNLDNLPLFSRLPGLAEVSIGHALVVDAVYQGLDNTVKAYLACLK